MIILGKTPAVGLGEQYIVQLNADELAKVCGYSYGNDAFRKDAENAMKAGQPIQISDIYKHYDKLVKYLEQSDYSTARAKLQMMIDSLAPVEAMLEEAGKLAQELEQHPQNRMERKVISGQKEGLT